MNRVYITRRTCTFYPSGSKKKTFCIKRCFSKLDLHLSWFRIERLQLDLPVSNGFTSPPENSGRGHGGVVPTLVSKVFSRKTSTKRQGNKDFGRSKSFRLEKFLELYEKMNALGFLVFLLLLLERNEVLRWLTFTQLFPSGAWIFWQCWITYITTPHGFVIPYPTE